MLSNEEMGFNDLTVDKELFSSPGVATNVVKRVTRAAINFRYRDVILKSHSANRRQTKSQNVG